MKTGRNAIQVVGIAAAVIALAGCATQPSAAVATPTPTATASANEKACLDFGTFTNDIAQVMSTPPPGSMVDATKGMDAQLDASYLEASGEVAKRISALQDDLPPKGIYMLYLDNTAYLANAKAVVRACEAEGVDFGKLN